MIVVVEDPFERPDGSPIDAAFEIACVYTLSLMFSMVLAFGVRALLGAP